MKKLVYVATSVLLSLTCVSCKGKNKTESLDFKPSLDTNTRCSIKVVGDYSNFEALEAEFDRFNDYYPNVVLTYRKNNDYVNTLGNALSNEDAPNIFFSYAAWMAGDEKYNPIIEHMEDLSNPDLKINLDILRSGLVNHTSENKVLMAPLFSRTYGALVNNDLFLKENIAIPKNWNELLSACASFKDKGYVSPIMGYNANKDKTCWTNTVAYPMVVATLAGNQEAMTKANNLDNSAGEYLREALNKVKQLVDSGAIDNDACNADAIANDYEKVLLRFFKGDVPMMVCTADTVSGRKKREKESSEFTNNPFGYTFMPIPLTDQGGFYIDSPSVQFSVNKDCKNLDMTNEFMRFLFHKEELKNLASLKGLINPTKDETLGAVYAPFAQIPAERTFSPEALGVKDPLVKQIRLASYYVGMGTKTIDEVISGYGTLS